MRTVKNITFKSSLISNVFKSHNLQSKKSIYRFMNNIKTYENWVSDQYNKLKYRSKRYVSPDSMFNEDHYRYKLKELGFKFDNDGMFDGVSSIAIYESPSDVLKITIEFRFQPRPGMNPGRDAFRVNIIKNGKKKVKWFTIFDEKLINYIEENIPEVEKYVDKYNI
jgi:hypothetical protein